MQPSPEPQEHSLRILNLALFGWAATGIGTQPVSDTDRTTKKETKNEKKKQ